MPAEPRQKRKYEKREPERLVVHGPRLTEAQVDVLLERLADVWAEEIAVEREAEEEAKKRAEGKTT